MRKVVNKEAAQELRDLETKHGRIKPADVVKKARFKTSALHSYFEWNNSKAAHQHRLEQARDLIVSVTVLFEDKPHDRVIKAREFVSLPSDRQVGGGYRNLQSVLSDADLRAELLHSALEDLRVFKERYRTLNELAQIFAAIDKTTAKHNRSRKGGARKAA